MIGDSRMMDNIIDQIVGEENEALGADFGSQRHGV